MLNLRLLLLLLTFFSVPCLAENLALPAVFSDHMVLQRDCPVPVWGKAEPHARIAVRFARQKKTATADENGAWRVVLSAMKASAAPRELTVSSKLKSETVSCVISNVLVGEVWLCSGQSNMQWGMDQTEHAEAAIAEAHYPSIRLFNTPRIIAREPKETIDSRWNVCTPETVKYFSGVAYYFGRKLHRDLDVPVGLLLSAWGGTKIEPWTPSCGFEGIDSLADMYELAQNMPELGANPRQDRQTPTAIFNGMVHAHIPFAIRGAIWYQGEANRHDGMLYVDKTKALLNGWRRLWGYEFPFYFVQIAPFQYENDDPAILPTFWEAQSAIVKTIPKTGMAVISDCATLDNIHPPNKEIPGIRLALLAEADTYGMKVVSTGPVFRSLSRQADTLVVKFDSDDGLTTRDGNPPDWFEIAGADGAFKTAAAKISDHEILLSSQEVAQPDAVRFAWHKLATPNLVNGAGLPAAAFRAALPQPLTK